MKRLLIFLLILVAATMQAQRMDVTFFDEAPKDITARRYERLDNNHEPCAVIKVQLVEPGAKFVGNVVGDVEYNVNTYSVYMAAGSKRLTINLPGYFPRTVEFADYGIRELESHITYTMRVEFIENEMIRPKTIVKSGKYFYYDGTTPMNRKAYERFLEENCEFAAKRYKQGKQIYRTGWWCLGSVPISQAIGWGLYFGVTGRYYDNHKQTITNKNGLGEYYTYTGLTTEDRHTYNAIQDAGLYGFVIGTTCIFGTIGLVCIPVGYAYANTQSVNIYNASCATKRPEVTLNLQTSADGIGLALHF